MSTTTTPRIIDGLYAFAADAFDPEEGHDLGPVLVSDGWKVGNDGPGRFLMIGVEDPAMDNAHASATSRQEWMHAGHSVRDEYGEITCCAHVWTGDVDAPGERAVRKYVRDQLFAVVGALEDALRADPALGMAADGVRETGFGTRTTFSQADDDTGTSALLVFQIAYIARI